MRPSKRSRYIVSIPSLQAVVVSPDVPRVLIFGGLLRLVHLGRCPLKPPYGRRRNRQIPWAPGELVPKPQLPDQQAATVAAVDVSDRHAAVLWHGVGNALNKPEGGYVPAESRTFQTYAEL